MKKAIKIIVAILLAANAGMLYYADRKNNDKIIELSIRADQIKKQADSLQAVNMIAIDRLREERTRDSIEYQSIKLKLNKKVYALEKSIEEYRRRLVDLGDLPIY